MFNSAKQRAFKAFWYKLLLPTIVSKGLKKIMNYNIYDLTCFFSSSFEEVNCNLSQKPEFLLERNPNGKVPVLEINGKVFIESSIINDLLDDLYPDPPLYPKDPYAKAEDKIFMEEYSSKVFIYVADKNICTICCNIFSFF